MSLLGCLLGVVLAQEEPLGRMSDAEFFSLFTGMGFTRYSVSLKSFPLPLKKLKSGGDEFYIQWTNYADQVGEASYVGDCKARAEFDLPRPLSKRALEAWMTQEGLGQMSSSSLLGGRIVISSHLYDLKSSQQALTKRTMEFLEAVRKVKKLAEELGGKPASELYGLGRAKFEPLFRLDWIEDGDAAFLQKAMGWKDGPFPGGGRGWQVSCIVRGVHLYVNGMPGKSNVLIIYSTAPNRAKAEKHVSSGKKIDWADGHVTPEDVFLYTQIDQSKGITAGELAATIERFAIKAKSLDLF
jgi:hypothetical protein